MQKPFESVREHLLRAGFSPRHASRYVCELRDHLADLTSQERESGIDDAEANKRARLLLGSDAQLAQAMIERGGPRALAARAPWSMFTLLPAALLVLIVWITNFSMFHVLWPLRELVPSGLPASYATLIATVSFISSYLIGPLVAAGCVVVALRQRVESGWVWVGLAAVSVFSSLLGFHMHIIPPMGGGLEGARFSVLALVYENGQANHTATLAYAALRASILFVAAAVAYQVFRKRLIPTLT